MSGRERKLRPLIPAAGSESSARPPDPPPPAREKPKRQQVAAACLECQKSKTKCDGTRPTCKRCFQRNLQCLFDVDPDVSRVASLKRKHETLNQEISDLKELFGFLRSRSEGEAVEILRRIRAIGDPSAVLRFVKEGDLLLQGPFARPSTESQDPRLKKLNDDALSASAIRVPADPWTLVAEDGLISELISSFFQWDNPFYAAFIDQRAFLHDMHERNIQRSMYCSPLLVNAICALRCYTSDRARTYGLIQGYDMRDKFLTEAKRCFEAECGRAKLPTVQALLIMYLCNAGLGKDRAGMIYRYTAYEMLKRLRLDRQYARATELDDTIGAREHQRAISRAAWGFFVFESISAFAYLKPSLIRPPSLPRDFEQEAERQPDLNDILGNEYDERKSPQPPLVPAALGAMSDLSIIFYDVMNYNRSAPLKIGSNEDIEKRVEFYTRLQEWKEDLPDTLRIDKIPTPQTYYLSTYEDKVVLALFRPFDGDFKLPKNLGAPLDLCLSVCHRILRSTQTYQSLWPANAYSYSIMSVYPLYDASLTLISRLSDPRAPPLFTEICELLLPKVRDFPFTAFLLQALKALAEKLNMPLPEDSRAIFGMVDIKKEDLDDVPISFVIPQHTDMMDFLSDEGDGDDFGAQLGTLITKWSSLSFD